MNLPTLDVYQALCDAIAKRIRPLPRTDQAALLEALAERLAIWAEGIEITSAAPGQQSSDTIPH